MAQVPSTSAAPPSRRPPELRDIFTDALRYWERKRVLYNCVLLAVVLTARAGRWGGLLEPAQLLALLFEAISANVLFCAAYAPDIFVQLSDFRDTWRGYRWVLFLVGTVFASLLAALLSG